MKILLTGATGGIGLAIKERLKQHKLTCLAHTNIVGIKQWEEFDWMITAHGIINEEDAKETFFVNTLANIKLTKNIKAKNVIFISSTAGIKGNDKYPVYSASKAALNMYAKLKGYYVICPGATDTPGWRKLGITDVEPQSPDEVAKAVERIMNGEFNSGDIITVRNGIIS